MFVINIVHKKKNLNVMNITKPQQQKVSLILSKLKETGFSLKVSSVM